MKDLGLNSYRFSIEWSRIEPQEGVFAREAIEHYRSKIRNLKKAEIEPVVTLWHYTNPVWFEQSGGWESINAVFRFSRYVKHVIKELGEEINFCLVLNEPLVYSIQSYLLGRYPPQKKNFFAYSHVINTLIVAQYSSYRIIKKINPKIQVSSSINLAHHEPQDNNFLTRVTTDSVALWDSRFLRLTLPAMDYIGFNYYFRAKVKGMSIHHSSQHHSDLGWGLHPSGIYEVLAYLKKFNKPIMITENGLADARDLHRKWWLEETISAIAKARHENIPVIGYQHWSLLDNFEWDKGFWPKFGLVEVDRKSQNRIIRPSAAYYRDLIKKQDF